MLNVRNRLVLTTALAMGLGVVGSSAQAFDGEVDLDWQNVVHPSGIIMDKAELEKYLPQSVTKKPTIDLDKLIPAKKSAVTLEKVEDAASDSVLKAKMLANEQKDALVAQMESLRNKTQSLPDSQFEPLVKVAKDGKTEVTQTFVDIALANLFANDLSYDIVKGNVQLSDEHMTRLKNIGWDVAGSFTALEGKHLNFGDHAGLVLYNNKLNMFQIVWHGTASNEEGWQTNIDAELITDKSIPSRILSTFAPTLLNMVEAESAKHTITELNALGEKDPKKLREARGASILTLNKIHKYVSDNFSKNALKDKSVEQLQKAVVDFTTFLDGFKEAVLDPILKNRFIQELKIKVEIVADAQKRKDDLGLEMHFKGKAHNGYTKKVYTGQAQIEQILMREMKKLTPEQQKTVRFAVTGHSMAGALSKMSALELAHAFEKITGQKLNNAVDNRIYVHALSAAPTGDAEYADYITSVLGTNNMFDQRVESDLVPKAYLSNWMYEAMGNIPWAGKELQELTEKFKGYAPHIGALAVDLDEDVKERAEKLAPSKKAFEQIADVAKAAGSAIVEAVNPVSFVTEIKDELEAEASNLQAQLNLAKVKSRNTAAEIAEIMKLEAQLESTTSRWGKFKSGVKAGLKKIGKRAVNIIAKPVVAVAVNLVSEKVVRDMVAVPHYGVKLPNEKLPEGQDYGRDEHFEPDLATADPAGFNKMLAEGVKNLGKSEEEIRLDHEAEEMRFIEAQMKRLEEKGVIPKTSQAAPAA